MRLLARLAVASVLAFVTACGGGSSSPPPGTPTPTAAPTTSAWTLAWSDEFDGPANTSPKDANWLIEQNGSGNGNAELQYYTTRTQNVALDGQGHLSIHELQEHYTGPDGTREYTSGRLNTSGRHQQTYGKYEARMHIPRGHGMWPAFWLLGANIGSVGWPACGELDVMENIGIQPETVVGSMHGPGYFGANSVNASFTAGAPLADDFHTYGLEWDTDNVRWYLDGALYESRRPSDLPAPWVFDHDFFVLVNVAVGGSWPGNPDSTTVFPQRMDVDYVRAYKAAGS